MSNHTTQPKPVQIPGLSEFEIMIFKYGQACRNAESGKSSEDDVRAAFGALHRAIVNTVFAAIYPSGGGKS